MTTDKDFKKHQAEAQRRNADFITKPLAPKRWRESWVDIPRCRGYPAPCGNCGYR
jgi:hypothetical protein